MTNIDDLMARHWLTFIIDGSGGIVRGCNCGFDADIDADCGYGDSVVRHLLIVGASSVAGPDDGSLDDEEQPQSPPPGVYSPSVFGVGGLG